MERLFQAKTDAESALVLTITTHKDANTRKKALVALRVLNGVPANDLYAIRSKENYSRIPGKPIGWNRFNNASLFYDDCRIQR